MTTNFYLYSTHKRQIDGLAPTFLKKPAIRQEDDGKRLLFECLIKADPLPQVRWSHNNAPVSDDARHKVSYEGKYQEMKLIEIFLVCTSKVSIP